MEPQEEKPYYFFVKEDTNKSASLVIVSKEYWDANKSIESVHLFDELQGRLPDIVVDELAESMFLSEAGHDVTVAQMVVRGFIFNPEIGKLFG